MERTPARLYHFSEDDSIRGFELRPAPSDPGGPLGVRAVDAVHAPLYWFPRRCPRLYVWAECPEQQDLLTDRFGTDAARIVAIESAWLDPVRTSGGLDALGPGDCAIGAWGARTLGGVFPETLRRAALLNVLGGDDETRGT